MLYDSDINGLLSQWEARLNCPESDDSPSYKDALRDCIYDVKSIIDADFTEEILEREAFEQQLADNYLSTIEAHDALLCS